MWKDKNVYRIAAIVVVAFVSMWITIHSSHVFSNPPVDSPTSHTHHEHDKSTTTDIPSTNKDDDFCSGMYMIMAMSGFQWSLFGSTSKACLLYFAPEWRLDGIGKFQGAMAYSFLLAVLTEGVHTLHQWMTLRLPHNNNINNRTKHFLLSLVYAIDRWMGYVIMLVAMMFSWEMLLSVIFGVMVGRLLFPNEAQREWRREENRRRPNTVRSATTIPTPPPSPPPSKYPTLATTICTNEVENGGDNEEKEPLLSLGDSSLPYSDIVRRRR